MCLQARITSGSVLAQVNAGKLIGNSFGLELDFPMRKARVGLPETQNSSLRLKSDPKVPASRAFGHLKGNNLPKNLVSWLERTEIRVK